METAISTLQESSMRERQPEATAEKEATNLTNTQAQPGHAGVTIAKCLNVTHIQPS